MNKQSRNEWPGQGGEGSPRHGASLNSRNEGLNLSRIGYTHITYLPTTTKGHDTQAPDDGEQRTSAFTSSGYAAHLFYYAVRIHFRFKLKLLTWRAGAESGEPCPCLE